MPIWEQAMPVPYNFDIKTFMTSRIASCPWIFPFQIPNCTFHCFQPLTNQPQTVLHFHLSEAKEWETPLHFHLFAVKNTKATWFCDFFASKSQPASCFSEFS